MENYPLNSRSALCNQDIKRFECLQLQVTENKTEGEMEDDPLLFCCEDKLKAERSKRILQRMCLTFKFNECKDDFQSLEEYNDYLEEVMEMSIKLIKEKDDNVVEEKIARYESENAKHDSFRHYLKGNVEPAHGAPSAGCPPFTNPKRVWLFPE